MTCNTLGISDCELRLSKSADAEIVGSAPTGTDLTDYTGEFVIRDSEGHATARLTVTGTPTGNGSVLVFSGALITLRLKRLDLQTIPDATDPDDPYVGSCELVVTAPAGLRTRIFLLPAIVEKGDVR